MPNELETVWENCRHGHRYCTFQHCGTFAITIFHFYFFFVGWLLVLSIVFFFCSYHGFFFSSVDSFCFRLSRICVCVNKIWISVCCSSTLFRIVRRVAGHKIQWIWNLWARVHLIYFRKHSTHNVRSHACQPLQSVANGRRKNKLYSN